MAVKRILETVRAECMATKLEGLVTHEWSEVTVETDDCVKVDDLNRVLDAEIEKLALPPVVAPPTNDTASRRAKKKTHR